MSAVYQLRNDHYVFVLNKIIKYLSLFEILSGSNGIIFCGEVLLHYFFAESFFAASSSALYF